MPHRLAIAHTQRAGRLRLTRRHRFDPRSVDLGHVGAVDHRQTENAVPERVGLPEPVGDADVLGDELEVGDAAGDQQQDDQDRDRAEDVDVGDREEAEGGEFFAGELADQGQDQAPEEGEDDDDGKQEEVFEEPFQHFAEVVPHDREVEVLVEEFTHRRLLLAGLEKRRGAMMAPLASHLKSRLRGYSASWVAEKIAFGGSSLNHFS